MSNYQIACVKVLEAQKPTSDAGNTHSKQKTCEQLLILWELNLCKWGEAVATLTASNFYT